MSSKTSHESARKFKIIVHVPKSHAEMVRKAMGDAGGGHVGAYSHCSFSYSGTRRFRPLEGANPHIGKVGQEETVEEECIEVSYIDESILKDVVTAMQKAHPYEESAYEIIELFDINTLA
tara:strand:- start:604 stop:963 length:360 start_codon:yes stop_codon:yes gene_type:complete